MGILTGVLKDLRFMRGRCFDLKSALYPSGLNREKCVNTIPMLQLPETVPANMTGMLCFARLPCQHALFREQEELWQKYWGDMWKVSLWIFDCSIFDLRIEPKTTRLTSVWVISIHSIDSRWVTPYLLWFFFFSFLLVRWYNAILVCRNEFRVETLCSVEILSCEFLGSMCSKTVIWALNLLKQNISRPLSYHYICSWPTTRGCSVISANLLSHLVVLTEGKVKDPLALQQMQ